jgi:hypothetical protein
MKLEMPVSEVRLQLATQPTTHARPR